MPRYNAVMPFEFPGAIFAIHEHTLLAYGPEAHRLGQPLLGPPVALRPGYHLFYEPDYLLPAAVIDDRGQRTSAPACYEWIETQGDLFPRADVIGERPSGLTETRFLKELDLTDMAVFAGSTAPFLRVDLAIEVSAEATEPRLASFPHPGLSRALLCYRLPPNPTMLQQLIASLSALLVQSRA